MPKPLLQEPAAVFMTIMGVIFIAPLLTKRFGIPGTVGLILAGMAIGQHGFHLLVTGPTISLFGSVGLIYLMFNAGLDIDLGQFNRVRNQSIVFAAISYLLPQLSGIGLGRLLLGLDWFPSVLLGATYASQTLLAYPMLSQLGIIRNDAVAITVGATIFTDITSLLILAVVTASQNGSVPPLYLIELIGLTVVYAAFILLAVPWLGKIFFRHVSGNVAKLQFVLVVLFVAAVLAERIGMHTIVGAFLAGLAVNSTISKNSKVVNQVKFLGNSLFVPMFLMTVGMRLNPIAIVTNAQSLLAGAGITIAVYITKFLAAWITGAIYDFTWNEIIAMWGLSQAQAAATLAIVLVGTQENILPISVLNGSILAVLLTSVTSPILVKQFGRHITKEPEGEERKEPSFDRILVPIFSEETPQNLLDLGALLAHANEGTMMPLILADNEKALKQRVNQIQNEGLTYPGTDIDLLQRIEQESQEGLLREATEEDASLILMDWETDDSLEDRILGEEPEHVLWNASVPVLLAKLTMSPDAINRLVLVIAAKTVGVKLADESVQAIRQIAHALDVPLLILATSHYADRLAQMIEDPDSDDSVAQLGENIVEEISEKLTDHDLVILTTMGSHNRFSADESKVPEALIESFTGSIAVFHNP